MAYESPVLFGLPKAVLTEAGSTSRSRGDATNLEVISTSDTIESLEAFRSFEYHVGIWKDSVQKSFSPDHGSDEASWSGDALVEQTNLVLGLFKAGIGQAAYLTLEESQVLCANPDCRSMTTVLKIFGNVISHLLGTARLLLSANCQASAEIQSSFRSQMLFDEREISQHHVKGMDELDHSGVEEVLRKAHNGLQAVSQNLHSEGSYIHLAPTSESLLLNQKFGQNSALYIDKKPTNRSRGFIVNSTGGGFKSDKMEGRTIVAGPNQFKAMQKDVDMKCISPCQKNLTKCSSRVANSISGLLDTCPTNDFSPKMEEKRQTSGLNSTFGYVKGSPEDVATNSTIREEEIDRISMVQISCGDTELSGLDEIDTTAPKSGVFRNTIANINSVEGGEAKLMKEKDSIFAIMNNISLLQKDVAAENKIHNPVDISSPRSVHIWRDRDGDGGTAASRESPLGLVDQFSAAVRPQPWRGGSTELIRYENVATEDTAAVKPGQNCIRPLSRLFSSSTVINWRLSRYYDIFSSAWWVVKLLLSHLKQHVKALWCVLRFLLFYMWSRIQPTLAKAVGFIQQLSWKLFGRRMTFLGCIDREAHHVAAPTSLDALCLYRQLRLVLTMLMYMSLHQERAVWLQANGTTRQSMLKHASLCDLRILMANPGPNPLGKIEGRCLMLLLVQLPDVCLEYAIAFRDLLLRAVATRKLIS